MKECPDGQFLNIATQECACPVGMFWNDVNCIACESGRVFNFDKKKC